MEEIGEHFGKFPLLLLLSRYTRVSVGKLVVVYLLLAIVLSLVKYTGNLVVLVTGILYPAYMSLNSVNSKEVDDDKQWLTYWVLFGGLNFVDYFLGSLTESIPFYYTLKLIYVIFLFWPSTRGSYIIYEKFLFPKFLNKELDDYNSVGSSDSKVRSYKED